MDPEISLSRVPLNPEEYDSEYANKEGSGAPAPIDPRTGQHKTYWVLPESERQQGFVRPIRTEYIHVGIPGPKYPLRDLTEEEKARGWGDYIKYEEYPEGSGKAGEGRLWTQERLDAVGKGCQTVTKMNPAIAETYARNPQYYGATFCSSCRNHLPVGEDGEFIWVPDGSRVGT